MEELTSTLYDAVLLGTDLSVSITAAALAQSGMKVLNLDDQTYYGSCDATLSWAELLQFLDSGDNRPFTRKTIHIPHVTYNQDPEEQIFQVSRSFNIDLQPKMLYSTGEVVDYMIKSAVATYIEFKAVKTGVMFHQGELIQTPCNKSQIFQDKRLELRDKRLLMRFIEKSVKLIESDFDPEMPFVAYLETSQLNEFLENIILYGILMVTGDRQEVKLGQALGVFKKYSESLSLYREGCALLYPTYGSGDLPQGFSRMAAVFQGTFVVSPKIKYNGIEDVNTEIKNLQTTIGNIQCKNLITGVTHSDIDPELYEYLDGFIVRGVILSNTVLIDFDGPVLIVIPPNQIGNLRPIYVLQLSQFTNSAPEGVFVYNLYVQTTDFLQDEAALGNILQHLNLNPLFFATFVQTVSKMSGKISHCQNFGYGFEAIDHFNEARRVFEALNPEGEFLPTRNENDINETDMLLEDI